MAEQVATNGFIAPPPVPGAPAVAAPAPTVQSFPPVPPVPGSGTPVQLPGQQPGYLHLQPQAPGAAPAAPAPAPAAQDLNGIVAMLQQALGQQPGAQPPAAPAPPDAGKPAWMQSTVAEFNVDTIQDPILKSMATTMQLVGKDLDLDRVLGRALAHGDENLIDLAYLQEKGGANAANLAQIAKGIVQSVNAKAEAVTREVHGIAGGEAQWNQATAVFNQAAPQELKLVVKQMLDSTNDQFIKAGAKIVAEFGRSSGMIPQIGAPTLGAATSGLNAQGLSKAAFQLELQKLDQNSPDYQSARESLYTRRSLGKRAGL